MTYYTLRSTRDSSVLYEGHFHSFVACLEHAIRNRIPLPHIDLRHKNLSNAMLDEAILPHADLSYTNLTGTNLSESYLKGASFEGAALYNTCLAISNLTACNFENATFGATDIHNTILSHARFSTLSCFSLDFTHTRQMEHCAFIHPDGKVSKMSRPPLVIKGFGKTPLIVLDDVVQSGHNVLNHTKLSALAPKLSLREVRRRLSSPKS